ncbi:hypothetical protein DL770_009133 [Monosporascus sp. CRB-9-2]|nr:hypothetical protein DL770_009133 [Monosporascus sp. CRB-9-2]
MASSQSEPSAHILPHLEREVPGGRGWRMAGRVISVSDIGMVGALGGGYATITTDAGVEEVLPGDWVLLSEGNLNLYALQIFASLQLLERVLTGWAAGSMLAQRYPELYDGIAASAPAINWGAFASGIYWPTVVLNTFLSGVEPDRRELDEVTAKAIEFCDALDGLPDGDISDDVTCLEAFEPQTLVGSSHFRKGSLARDSIGIPWLQLFVEKDSAFDLSKAKPEEYELQFHRCIAEFDSIIGTNDPDLREFNRQSRKMLTIHGMADQLIRVKGLDINTMKSPT